MAEKGVPSLSVKDWVVLDGLQLIYPGSTVKTEELNKMPRGDDAAGGG